MVVDLLAAEQARDPKPTVLYGLSAGGMLTYHVAAAAPRDTLRGIIGMTYLDQRDRTVADRTAHDLVTARLGAPLMGRLAGNAMWVRFLGDYMSYAPDVEPAEFDRCPVLLTQPAEDRWSPQELSSPVVVRLDPAHFSAVRLDGAGRNPLEEPGLRQIEDAVLAFVRRVTRED